MSAIVQVPGSAVASTSAAPITTDAPCKIPRPPLDPGLVKALEASEIKVPKILDIPTLRSHAVAFGPETVLKAQPGPQLEHTEYNVPTTYRSDDQAEIIISVFKPKESDKTDRPVLYSVHGGGQVAGNRFTALECYVEYFDGHEAVYVSPEYRLAPEFPAPAALYDSYDGLLWTIEHAEELGIDPKKIIVTGCSGGGPIAVGLAMLCRNNQKPYPARLMLLTPMLDDRDCTLSSKQFEHDVPWCGDANRQAWGFVLGKDRAGPHVSELISPARATDVTGLPPTFIDVGECEVFRDESVAFAAQLWKSGVNAELHVWPGAYHGFDMVAPKHPISLAAIGAKKAWVKRCLDAMS